MAASGNVRAVLFDLGNVLVRFSHRRMVQQVAECLGCGPAALETLFFDRGLLWQYERGQIDTGALHRALCQWAGREVPLQAMIEAASDIFWPDPAMEAVALELVELGVPVVVVSNTCPIHIEWIEQRFPFFRRLTRRVLSYEVGAAKPEPVIFERALEHAGRVAPQEALFIDDTLGHVEAAARLGLQAHQHRNAAYVRQLLEEKGLLKSGR